MIDIQKLITENVRRANDLQDVCRAIACASKIMAEKLDQMERELLNLFTKEED